MYDLLMLSLLSLLARSYQYCFDFSYCTRMQQEGITRAIIVVQMGMTPSAKQVNIFLLSRVESGLFDYTGTSKRGECEKRVIFRQLQMLLAHPWVVFGST